MTDRVLVELTSEVTFLTLRLIFSISHYEKTPIQIYGKFRLQKAENFQIKTLTFFICLLKNIYCGYSLEKVAHGPQFAHLYICKWVLGRP